jgi:hypothetical protein
MSNLLFLKSFSIAGCCTGVMLLLTGCGPGSDDAASTAAPAGGTSAASESSYVAARNMRLVGYHDLQARSAYQIAASCSSASTPANR